MVADALLHAPDAGSSRFTRTVGGTKYLKGSGRASGIIVAKKKPMRRRSYQRYLSLNFTLLAVGFHIATH